ncbi:MAG: D-2-hydroxyacid dehydrogenase [Paracoccaceae bacterium]|nr:D-2-hydroxyacid dehydrogenase [Paracoccaceae bacterium]
MQKNPTVMLHTDNPMSARDAIEAAHPDLSLLTCDSYSALPDMIEHHRPEVIFSVRFAGTPEFPSDAIIQSTTVRWVSVGGSGTDHLGTWDPAHLTVTNAAGVASDMMAEYTLGAMLHFSLDFDGFNKAKTARMWQAGSVTPIAGQRVLILGLGHTGVAVAARCKAMGLHVTGVRAHPAPTDAVDDVCAVSALPDLWEKADFVVICVPLLDSTRGMVDASAIKAMKPGAVVIDVSRGGVCDQIALAGALKQGHLKGAALDVFEVEPLPKDSPFWDLENVIVTPHCASVYEGWEMNSVAMFCENLTRYRNGKPLRNTVNPTRGY